MDDACQSAAALGVTITVAAGDNGSSDGASGNNVDFPASSPHVLGCGGTTLEGSGTTISSETVWNDGSAGGATGGGVSNDFALPDWQANAGVPASTSASGGRGVPDVAGDASPETGYNILVDGQQEVVGGTSAVAPLWAGLIALINQQRGTPVGFVNPTLYANPKRLSRHHVGQQWRVFGRSRMGCLYRIGIADRNCDRGGAGRDCFRRFGQLKPEPYQRFGFGRLRRGCIFRLTGRNCVTQPGYAASHRL